jgi:hypothetical protein
MPYTPNHGTVGRYNLGCRCDRCITTNPGKLTRMVIAQLDLLPPATRAANPGLCELAITLSRDLTNPDLGRSHAALGKQLQATLEALATTKVADDSKLASLTAMAERRKTA